METPQVQDAFYKFKKAETVADFREKLIIVCFIVKRKVHDDARARNIEGGMLSPQMAVHEMAVA